MVSHTTVYNWARIGKKGIYLETYPALIRDNGSILTTVQNIETFLHQTGHI